MTYNCAVLGQQGKVCSSHTTVQTTSAAGRGEVGEVIGEAAAVVAVAVDVGEIGEVVGSCVDSAPCENGTSFHLSLNLQLHFKLLRLRCFLPWACSMSVNVFFCRGCPDRLHVATRLLCSKFKTKP